MIRRVRLLAVAVVLLSLARAADFNAASATNQVGLDLYRQLATKQPGENLVISPYSIESALALVFAGADGATRAELARVLGFPAADEPLVTAFGNLRSALDAIAAQSRTLAEGRRQSGGRVDVIEWSAANRLFGQRTYAFRDSFLALMKDGYAAPFEPLDFRSNAERSRATINSWVEEQTRQKIRDLIPRDGVNENTRLVLVNALYLKAPWQETFEKAETKPLPFHVGGVRATRDVATMHSTSFHGYAREDGLTVVALEYLGRSLQFLILLPDEGQSVDAIAEKLTPARFAHWAKIGDSKQSSVELHLPRFRVEGVTVPLGQALRSLGVKSAFDEPRGSANFVRIAPRKAGDYLALSDVFHQTFVAVDEEGTEAAAATAATVVTLSAVARPKQPIEVRVDRPFLFAIQHRKSGICLFLGRITDPR